MKIDKPQSGFTIIELLVATTIFSIVLMVILSSFLQIGRMFYKGISVNNVNETANNVVNTIINDVRLAGSANTPDSANYFCIGPHRYTFILNAQVGAADTALRPTSSTITAGIMQDTISSGTCPIPSDPIPGTNPQQLLGPDMQLNDMYVKCDTDRCNIRAHIIFYGADNSVFNSSAHPNDTDTDHSAALVDPDAFCSGGLLSTQFCATAHINTTVTLRF